MRTKVLVVLKILHGSPFPLLSLASLVMAGGGSGNHIFAGVLIMVTALLVGIKIILQ